MTIIDEIAAERRRQIEAEGYGSEEDSEWEYGEMAFAAAAYAVSSVSPQTQIDIRVGRRNKWINGGLATLTSLLWPWDRSFFKPKGARRDLIRAAALIVAEIERLDRLSPPAQEPAP